MNTTKSATKTTKKAATKSASKKPKIQLTALVNDMSASTHDFASAELDKSGQYQTIYDQTKDDDVRMQLLKALTKYKYVSKLQSCDEKTMKFLTKTFQKDQIFEVFKSSYSVDKLIELCAALGHGERKYIKQDVLNSFMEQMTKKESDQRYTAYVTAVGHAGDTQVSQTCVMLKRLGIIEEYKKATTGNFVTLNPQSKALTAIRKLYKAA